MHERIKQRRKQLNYSVNDVAEKTGLSSATIYRIEQGRFETIPEITLIKLARCLRIEPDRLKKGWFGTVPPPIMDTPMEIEVPYDFRWASPIVSAYLKADESTQRAVCRVLEIAYVEGKKETETIVLTDEEINAPSEEL